MDANINAFGGADGRPKKQVLFLVTQSELGGAQQFILQFITHLKKDFYNIDVAVGSDGDDSLTHHLANLDIPVFIVPALKRDISPISDIRAIFQIKKLISKLEPDTIFLGSSKAGFIGALAAKFTSYQLPVTSDSKIDSMSHWKNKWKMRNGNRKMRPKVVYRIGGWSFNDPIPSWQKKLQQFLEKISASWKDVIIVNNYHDLEQAKKIRIKPRQNITLVHNGLDPYKINFLEKDTARSQLKIPSSKKVIGTIANFYPAKGLENIIKAAAKINREDIVWCIIGDGAGRNALEKLIQDKKLGDKIILAGRKESASSYLNAFDVFILPSVKEGFPWAVLEAMAAKLPIIATRVGAVPEILEDGINGYIIEPNNIDQIIDRLTLLLNNYPRAQEMGIQAHQKLLFDFNNDSMISQIERLL